MKSEILLKRYPKMGENIMNYQQQKNSESTLDSRPTLHYGRILLGEITPLLSAMKRTTTRWSSNQQVS